MKNRPIPNRNFGLFFLIFFVFCVVIAIAGFSYSVNKCGFGRAFLLGDRALLYAAMGYCDEKP